MESSLTAMTILALIAFTAVASVNGSLERKLDEVTPGSTVKCTPCTPASPPPPPPPVPCPPPPALLPPPALPPPTPKQPPKAYSPPPPPPSSPYIYIQGPPGDLYPVVVQDTDGSVRGSTSVFLIGFALLGLVVLW